ncbi:hypothetical protein BDV98DRAFT_572692 [Pterulicium gracile]|uniref:Uncharacterized protein n=1 Tax=Pterulicium gracile TaxID=1884261 RepID=A0A5C3Q8Q8_9AGAR|nr:hypothetical protein BDV98DRAFT_572692 [Pterula gracilis]
MISRPFLSATSLPIWTTSTSKEIVVSSRCHCPSTVKAVPKSCFVSDGSHIKACLDRNQAKKEVKRNVSYTLIGLHHLAPLVVSSLRVRQLLKPLEMLHPLSPRLPFLPAPELGRLHTAVLNQIQRPKSETFNGCSSCILAFDPESVETQLRGQQLLNVGMMTRVDLRAVAEECHSHAFNLSNLQAHEKDTYALCYDIAVPVVPRGRQMIEPCDWVFTSQRRHREQGGNGVGSEEKQGSEGPVGGARTEAIKAGNELAIKLRNRHRFCAEYSFDSRNPQECSKPRLSCESTDAWHAA